MPKMSLKRSATAAALAATCALIPLAAAPAAQAAPAPTTKSTVTSAPQGDCQAAWYYRSTGRGADTIVGVGALQANRNGTGSNQISTFSAQVSGTVSYSISGNIEVSAQTILANVKATFGVNVTASLTATLGNSVQVTAGPGKTAYAQYGVWRAYTTGVEEWNTTNCAVTTTHQIKAYSPYRVGWNTWVA